MQLEEFLNDYFKEIKEVGDFHFNYLISHKFKFPKTNYIELKRFIDTAVNFLKNIDKKILEGLAGKLYGDINVLYDFYKNFEKKSQYAELVFYNEYLENMEKYKSLKEEYESLKKSIEKYTATISISEEKLKSMPSTDPGYKKLKKMYVDAIHELSKKRDRFQEVKEELANIEKKEELQFFPKFNKYKEMYLKKLEKVINVKLFYFEKLLWYNASRSRPIVKFFDEAGIEGDFSTKTFIRYFLRNIDMSKSRNSDWLNYLQKILKVVE